MSEATAQPTTKNRIVELILCFFLGFYGGHRFYMRKYGTAIMYLFTFGLFGFGWLFDLIRIIVQLINHGSEIVLDSGESTCVSIPPDARTESDTNESSDEMLMDTASSDAIEPEPIPTPVGNVSEDAHPGGEEAQKPFADVPKPDYIDKTYKVTGVKHYEENLLNLAFENDDYSKSKRALVDDLLVDQRVWKYNFYPTKCELVPDPTNPQDEKAIKVVVDGEHVGYIKAGSCKHLLNVIGRNGIISISCHIGGGPYKIVNEDFDDNYNEVYTLEKDATNYFVTLHVRESSRK